MNRIRGFGIAGGMLLIAGWINVPAANGTSVTRQLEADKKRCADTESRAREAFIRQFDAMERTIRAASRVPAPTRAERIRTIRAEKTAFVDNGQMPKSEEMLPGLVRYQQSVHAARKPLAQAYARLMDQALKGGDDQGLQQLTADKAEFDAKLAGQQHFQAQTNWKGSRSGVHGNVDFDLWIGKRDGDTFRGTIWQDRGKLEARVEGVIDGNAISFHTKQVVQGQHRALRFDGFILENRLVLQVSGVAVGGGPASGIVVLNRSK